MDTSSFEAWGVVDRSWSGATPRLYGARARAAHGWMRGRGWAGLSRGRPEHWRAWWESLPLTAPSRNLARKVLMAYGDWLVVDGRRAINPATGIPAMRRRRGVPRPLDHSRALDLAHQLRDAPAEVRAPIALMLYCGLRITEARTLRWRDVDGQELHVSGKGGVVRRLPVPPVALGYLSSWRLACPSTKWVVPSPLDPRRPASDSWLRRHVQALAGCRPHQLRHTYATELCEMAGVQVVQVALGHSSLATTAIYTQVRPSGLAEAAARLYEA